MGLEVAVGVTSFLRLTALILSLQFSQGCTVDLRTTTPGASSACAPTAQQLTDFASVNSGILQTTGSLGGSTGCGTCHLSGGSGSGSYSVVTGSDTTALTTNYCSAKRLGSRLASHPQEASHSGGVYSASQIQLLIDFVNSL